MNNWKSAQCFDRAKQPTGVLVQMLKKLDSFVDLNPAGYDAQKSYENIAKIREILQARIDSGEEIDLDNLDAKVVPCGKRCGLCPECEAKQRPRSAPPGYDSNLYRVRVPTPAPGDMDTTTGATLLRPKPLREELTAEALGEMNRRLAADPFRGPVTSAAKRRDRGQSDACTF
jgi:hypothetical protein